MGFMVQSGGIGPLSGHGGGVSGFACSVVIWLLSFKSWPSFEAKSLGTLVTFTALSVAILSALLRSGGIPPPLSFGILPHFQVPFFCLSHLQTSLLFGSLSEQNDVFLSL